MQVIHWYRLTTRDSLSGLGSFDRSVYSVCRLGEVQSCTTVLQAAWGNTGERRCCKLSVVGGRLSGSSDVAN
jgi:hypothetical protein